MILDKDVQQRVAPLHDQQAGIKRGRIQVVGKLGHCAAGHRVLLVARPHTIVSAHVNAIALSSIETMSGSPNWRGRNGLCNRGTHVFRLTV